MPSLFSRRRASSQPPRPSAPPSASAAIAARGAFLQSSPSQASLSSAAAAAALRSHTTSPEPIGNLQTKRMMRRGSQSSIGSGSVMGRPGTGRGMVRRDSNASMTERTFRSPSPGRPEAVPPAADAPPVPTIPQSIPKGQRRSASVEPTMRISSPTPRKGGRHASVDMGAGRGRMTPASPAAAATPRNRPAELERENSLSRSVNFSRPMSPAAMTASAPPARPQSATGWFSSPKVGTGTPRNTAINRPQSALAMSASQARQIEQDVQSAASKPVLKKKKNVVQANEGQRLADGTMHSGPTGSAVQNTNTTSPVATSTQAVPRALAGDTTPVKKKKKKTVSSDTDDSEGPLPKNPTHFSPRDKEGDRSPISSRAAGFLHKQPSVVREDPEAEHKAENDLSVVKRGFAGRSASVKEKGRTVSTSEGPARAYVAPGGAPRQRTVSLDIPRDMSQRNSSLTPPRNHAHFSDVVINTPANKFNPPGRSVSPFKSAMKHSPSSSLRNVSPAGLQNGSRGPVSGYASDTTSLTSQDGSNAGKKKKSVRVSFDDGGTTVTPSVASVTPNTSKAIRRELSPTAATDSDADEGMTPRPALPSFGSVRGRKSHSPEQAEKVTETVNSSTSTSVATLPERPEVTSDHALGAVFADDFAKRAQFNQQKSLQPEAISVDRSGYQSDSSVYSEEPAVLRNSLDEYHPALSDPVAEQSTASDPKNDIIARVLSAPVVPTSGSQAPTANLPIPPAISVQPATPGIEEDTPILGSVRSSASLYSMPGGWEESEESKGPSTVSSRVEAIVTQEPDFESSDEEESLEPPAMETERHSPLLEPTLEPIYESDSDASDAFSDAAEDPSEFDLDGGFASLDAIVESPVQPHSPNFAASTPPKSPLSMLPPLKQPVSLPSPLNPTRPATADGGDWNSATAYWSSLTREKKDQMERLAQDDEVKAPVLQQPKPKKRTQAPAAISEPAPAPARRSLDASQEKPVSILKKSMRAAAEPTSPTAGETHMRSSMRSGGGGGGMKASLRPGSAGGMRTSMRQEHTPRSSVDESRGALQKNRASAPSAGSLGAAAAAAARTAPTASPAKAHVAPPFTADDSDSESSFRKQRKRAGSASTVNSQAGGFGMKRSMRPSSVGVPADRRAMSPTPAPRGSGRMSVRSISPNGSFMGRNNMDTLRTSLRGGPVDDAPTMRGKNSKAMRDAKSPTRFGMSGFSKPAKTAPSTTSASKPTKMFKSRFADSDDSDDGAPSGMGFSSRFADSDEEDSPVGPSRQAPTNLAPVRGIPRRSLQDDSTDLEDSDDEIRPSSNNKKTKKASARVSKTPIVPAQSDIDAAMEIARRNVAAMNGGREPGVMPAEPRKQVRVDPEPQTNGVAAAIPPATPTKRAGFLGMLGRRRTSSVASVPQIPSNYFASPGSNGPLSPALNGPKSPTGRLQRRTTTRANSSMSTAIPEAPQTREGMLAEQQKVNTPGGLSLNSQNWPLASPGKINADGERPATSDGVELRKTMRGGGMVSRPPRPDLNRRSMSGGDLDRFDRMDGKIDNKNGVYSERTGKKKKFGFLRRAFGLND